ncbi:ABC transporter permease [Curtobacterium sp. MCJR17_043]|uniref:ABC transporter permease n=1 Tax=Curtobacterium sp. MCJR17_043 TaxID=2175660 RepID=UPI0024DF72D9|nr:ABC transporter permease [Curtobacterium sp. MCJR17_043]WIB36879.1 ABC transporter permease [Curtobacterium sp. MCJR17_043]
MSTPRNDRPRKNDLPERAGGARTAAGPPAAARSSAPPKQQIGRYRRWYSTLHPSLQLIGLQLWMPLFFIVGFCLCYVFAFHAPHPHDVPVALVGSDPSFVAAVQKALPGEFVFHTYDSLAAAKRDVLAGSMAVAYDPSTNTFFKASAHQFQVANLVPATLTAVSTGIGVATPQVTELAALPARDEYGTVPMYVMLAWCIGGYMVAMFIGIMGGPLRHRTRMTVIVVGGLVISVITNTLAGPVVGAISGHFVPLVLIAWGWIVAIGLAVNGLSYFVGRFIAAPRDDLLRVPVDAVLRRGLPEVVHAGAVRVAEPRRGRLEHGRHDQARGLRRRPRSGPRADHHGLLRGRRARAHVLRQAVVGAPSHPGDPHRPHHDVPGREHREPRVPRS